MVRVLGWCRGKFSFIYWFQGCNLLLDDQYFKRGEDIKKREDQISYDQMSFFSFLSIKIYVTVRFRYSYFSRYYTKREMTRTKLMTALLF